MTTDYKDTVTMIDNCKNILNGTNGFIEKEGLLNSDNDKRSSTDRMRFVDYTIASDLNFVLIELSQIVKLLQNLDESNLDGKPNAELIEMTTAFNKAFNEGTKQKDDVVPNVIDFKVDGFGEHIRSNTRDIRALSEEMASVQHDVIRLKSVVKVDENAK